MPEPIRLILTDEEREQLEAVRDRDPKPHAREKAAALLKIADGHSGNWVARHGLLRPRKPDTVYAWLDRYLVDGLAGLWIRAGRGRKPAFSPSLLE